MVQPIGFVQRLETLPRYAAFGILALSILCTGYALWNSWLAIMPVPYGDMIYWAETYYSSESMLERLWAQHNEHRLYVMRLIVWLDIWAWQGILYPNWLITIALYGLALASIVRLLLRDLPDPTLSAISIGVLGFVATRSFLNWDFTTATNQPYPLVAAFAIMAAIGAAKRADISPQPWRWALLFLGQVGAAGCAINGIVLWPFIAWLMHRCGWRRRAIVVFCVISGAFSLAYMIGFQRPPHHPDPLALSDRLGTIALFILDYYGSPWWLLPGWHLPARIFAAATVLLSAVALIWRVLLQPSTCRIENIGLVLVGFGLLSAILVAIARAGYFSTMGTVPRFAAFLTLHQIGLLLVLVAWAIPFWNRLSARLIVISASLAVALVVATEHRVMNGIWVDRVAAQNAAIVKVLAGARDDATLSEFWPTNENYIRRAMKFLEAERIYLFRP